MSFADHFSTIAAGYAAYRPHYPSALIDALADRCAHHDVAWDAGCGNGQLSIGLAARFARVIAQDPSQAQIDSAQAHERVEYRCAAAETSGLPDRSVDLAVAAQAAHWFDWPRYVAEVARIARPGALAALVSYGIVLVEGDAGAVITRYYHDDAGPFWPPGRKHVENNYRDLVWPWPDVSVPAPRIDDVSVPAPRIDDVSVPAPRIDDVSVPAPRIDDVSVPAPRIDMTACWTLDELIGYVATWSATVKLVDTRGPAPFEALRTNLAAVWPDNEPRAIRWPLTLKLGTV